MGAPSPAQNGQSEDRLSFKTEFAVEMHCEACVNTVKNTLSNQHGVERFDIDLKKQSVLVQGKASPSQIARALKVDGRQVIVRGTGSTDAASAVGAAVCIFESYTAASSSVETPGSQNQEVHGIARMVQVGHTTILDLTVKHDGQAQNDRSLSLNGLPQLYSVYIATSGDISRGASSTGAVLRELGTVEMRKNDNYGDLFTEVKELNIWEMIGRAMVIAPIQARGMDKAHSTKLGPGILAGVIARSAGAWTNDKTVCTCSGQTMWQENRLLAMV